MRLIELLSRSLTALLVCLALSTPSPANDRALPDALEPWRDWATWDDTQLDCPAIFNDAGERICYWPSALALDANDAGAKWSIKARVFADSWLVLPGSLEVWPVDVQVDEQPMAVVQHEKGPAVKLAPGEVTISGAFRWNRMPQSVTVPRSIGIVSLTVDGREVPNPTWDSGGTFWLKRIQRDQEAKDLLSVLVYRAIEDGIPLWLRTDIELTVSGKSREETLGTVLPEGWTLSRVESPIPVAVDEQGQMQAQVRAGKWTVRLDAFRTADIGQIEYADDATPIIDRELIALKSDPSFRVVQLEGIQTIDASQTNLPSKWSGLPVYQWQTDQPFQLVEMMRGMGDRRPDGMRLRRRLWLDEDGAAFTYQDRFEGEMQQVWRLDASKESDLGAVRVDEEAQLITVNPQTNLSGVEIRQRDLKLEAVGRIDRQPEMTATGWQTGVDSLDLTLTLPPGWRALAVLGADDVSGDWLTAWSLLDLFLLLVFSLAVCRLYGIPAGVVAFLAFGLAYHELGAPRLTWLFLLFPIALLRVIGNRSGRPYIQAWRYVAAGFLMLALVPFVAIQVQSVIFPQLEPAGFSYGSRGFLRLPGDVRSPRVGRGDYSNYVTAEYLADSAEPASAAQQVESRSQFKASNLLQDPKSKIQTGPAEPKWEWNDVRCRWSGPVSEDQTLRPILMSLAQTRLITLIRIALLLLLATILLRDRQSWLTFGRRKVGAAAALLMMALPTITSAQVPDEATLQQLRERLLAVDDAFPHAAEIQDADLVIQGSQLSMELTVHTALEVAVPIPGKLPAWSPVSVTLDGESDAIVTRRDDYLWALVPKGVHQLSVTGLLGSEGEWAWPFLLKPKYVTVDADGWTVTGIDANGVPETQVFFVREQEIAEDQAAYDRSDFAPVVVVDRHLEIGLVSKLRTVVKRLSARGKAVAVDVPLIEGESVLSPSAEVVDRQVAVRMGAAQTTFQWQSELPYGQEIQLVAATSGNMVERWHLVTSPIWNVELAGLAPIFEPRELDLIPLWQPWPGEEATVRLSKPIAVTGDVMTVQNVTHKATLGSRRRTHELSLQLESSLANDFELQLQENAEITLLERDGQALPVQRRGASLIIPAAPGSQSISLQWHSGTPMATWVESEPIVLPVNASNVTQAMLVPNNRWILWADGPLRGPAVRFWTILVVAVLTAIALGSLPQTPLKRWEWVLLMIGLTQVHLVAAAFVVGWLFLLSIRGREKTQSVSHHWINVMQLMIAAATPISLIILMVVVGEGLLGNPDMFIQGNGSSRTYLQWFQPRIGLELPTTKIFSISVWFYRLLMLFWALWLASALLRWLTWGWTQFSRNGVWHRAPKPTAPAN